jgi:hypothetical protein
MLSNSAELNVMQTVYIYIYIYMYNYYRGQRGCDRMIP